MKPPPFRYADPTSVDEVLGLLTEFGDDAKILAGGQSLIPLLNLRLAAPGVLVDINNVDELDYVRVDDGVLAIGALTRQTAVEECELAVGAWSLLREATSYVGHRQIRNRGTVGGSLAHAPASAGDAPTTVTVDPATAAAAAPPRNRRRLTIFDGSDHGFRQAGKESPGPSGESVAPSGS